MARLHLASPAGIALSTPESSHLAQGRPLSAPFGAGVADITLPEGQTYTLRLLRSGYLYVFNELRGSWSGYVVTERGYLFPYVTEVRHDVLAAMDPQRVQGGIDALLQPPPREEEFSCTLNPDHHYPGRCLTIPNADEAGDIYLAFSDTAWTKRVWHEHATNAAVGDGGLRRRDHMRKLSLVEWRGGSAEHAAPLGELEERVAEAGYAWLPAGMPALVADEESVPPPSPFGHSLAPMNGIGGQVEGLKRWANTQAEPLDTPPVMVALEDPVGIASELNELAKIRANEWAEEPERKQKHQSALMIGAIRQAVEHGAEHQESERRSTLVGVLGALLPAHVGMATGGEPGRAGVMRGMERAGRIEEVELDAIHDRAWEKYQSMYDEDARRHYLENEYPEALAAFEQAVIAPLDTAYLAWLQGEALRKHLLGNYDRHDVESGIGFTGALYSMLLDATGRKTVCDYLETCLQADPQQPEAFVTRGLVFNQDSLARQWMEATTQAIEPHGGWNDMASFLYGALRERLVDVLGSALDALKRPMASLSNYSYELSAVMMRYLQRLYDLESGRLIGGVAEYRIVAILGVVAKHDLPNHRLVSVRTEPTRLQTVRILQRATEALSDDVRYRSGPPNEIASLFEPTSSRRYPYQGLLLVEETQAVRMEMAGRISPTEFDIQAQSSIRQVRLEAGSHFVGGLLAIRTLGSAWEKIKMEPGLKSTAGFASGLAALTGSVMEGGGAALRKTTWGGMRLARPMGNTILSLTTRAAALGFAGKLVGTIGAVISGVLAIWEGVEEWSLSPVYGTTMIILGAGMLLAGYLVIAAATSPAGFVLALVLALIMVVVGFLKKDEIQKWLDRAIEFGHDKTRQRFVSVIEQLEAMKSLGQQDGDQAVMGG